MNISYLQIIIPLVSTMVNTSTQVISFRLFPKIGLLKSEYFGFLIGFLTFMLLESYIFFAKYIQIKEFLSLLMVNLIIYFAFSYLYFTFLNLGETARRVRILRELYDSRQGLSMDEILQNYNAEIIIDKRISRLLNNKQIILRQDRYYIGSPIMLAIAKVIVAMKLVILGKKSELVPRKRNYY